MTDRPIIFSAPMIRALLDGRKSMTRRVLKPNPDTLPNGFAGLRLPYAVGDRLWCREGFAYGWPVKGNHQLPECNQEHAITYRADGNQPFGGGKWKSSIHMPRWASRLTLIVTDVRVQRLQEISEADAVAEGIRRLKSGRGYYDPTVPDAAVRFGEWTSTARQGFQRLWDSLHGDGAWEANPWCAALTFTVHHCNIDQMPGGNHE